MLKKLNCHDNSFEFRIKNEREKTNKLPFNRFGRKFNLFLKKKTKFSKNPWINTSVTIFIEQLYSFLYLLCVWLVCACLLYFIECKTEKNNQKKLLVNNMDLTIAR